MTNSEAFIALIGNLLPKLNEEQLEKVYHLCRATVEQPAKKATVLPGKSKNVCLLTEDVIREHSYRGPTTSGQVTTIDRRFRHLESESNHFSRQLSEMGFVDCYGIMQYRLVYDGYPYVAVTFCKENVVDGIVEIHEDEIYITYQWCGDHPKTVNFTKSVGSQRSSVISNAIEYIKCSIAIHTKPIE
jgi:hypothetical protein